MLLRSFYLFGFFSVLFLQHVQAVLPMQQLRFLPVYGEVPLVLDKLYANPGKDSLSLSSFRFYVSDIELIYSDGSVYAEAESYHLLDAEDTASLLIEFKNAPSGKISTLRFQLGLDSLYSVSGALSGDLDPTKGMYWSWQSGYINVKLEGRSTDCPSRKNEFHFHLGGYLYPYKALRAIQLTVPGEQQQELIVLADVAQFFSSLDLSQTYSVMIPGKEALSLSEKMEKIFSIRK